MTIKVLNDFLPEANSDKLGASKVGETLDINSNGVLNVENRTMQITNCLTEIPQDINLELNNETLILKAGSKVYVPNGAGIFDDVVISNDIMVSCGTTTGKTMVFYRHNNATVWGNIVVDTCYSGTSAPSDGMFYNTSTNNIYYYGGGTEQDSTFSLPLAIITVSSGTITSIDQVFNGIGFIGNELFTTPGIKGLIPNGRNSDGSLINTEFETNSVFAVEVTQQALETRYNTLEIGENGISVIRDYQEVYKLPENPSMYTHVYLIPENKQYFYDGTSWQLNNGRINCARIYGETTIESLTPKTVFRIPDYNDVVKYVDKKTVINWIMPDYSASMSRTVGTEYTAQTNGWLELYGGGGGNGGYGVDGGAKITINGVEKSYNYTLGEAKTWTRSFYPISAGMTYKGSTFGTNPLLEMTWYPCIGG